MWCGEGEEEDFGKIQWWQLGIHTEVQAPSPCLSREAQNVQLTQNPCSAWSNSLRLFPSRQTSTTSQPQDTSPLLGCSSEKPSTDLAQILTCRDFSNKEKWSILMGWREGGLRSHSLCSVDWVCTSLQFPELSVWSFSQIAFFYLKHTHVHARPNFSVSSQVKWDQMNQCSQTEIDFFTLFICFQIVYGKNNVPRKTEVEAKTNSWKLKLPFLGPSASNTNFPKVALIVWLLLKSREQTTQSK